MSSILDLHHLHKIYPGGVHAVSDVSFSLPQGQIFGLLGTNGAGKTTTIKMICGLITPTSGSIQFHGQEIQKTRALMKHIGAVLEGTRNVYWRLTAWHNLMYFGRLKGLKTSELKPRAASLLQEMGLWERRQDEVGKFSRGMQQKVAVAAALMADPPLLLLDEPTLGLDVQASRYIKDLLLKLAREQGKTIILTTHQLDVAQSVCDRIAIMRQGKIVTDQPKETLMKLFAQEHYEVRLGGIFHSANGLTPIYENGETVLSFPTQAALYDGLESVRQSDLSLLSISRKTPTLEDVFIRVLEC